MIIRSYELISRGGVRVYILLRLAGTCKVQVYYYTRFAVHEVDIRQVHVSLTGIDENRIE